MPPFSPAQLPVFAAIVATIAAPPVALLAALGAFAFGVHPLDMLTWGGSFGEIAGAFAWWLALFVPALAYAAYLRH